jgi:PAS domain S-box-containing protein
VTELKAAEEALRRSEESLAVTLRSIGDAVLATDTEGRVTRLNPVAEKLTCWTQAEAQGRPVAEVFRIINAETRQPAVIPVEKVLASGELRGLANHTVLIARDGTERPIADSAAPIRDQEGRLLGVVLVFRDVTEERRVEQELRRFNTQLEELVAQRTAEMRQALLTLDAMADGAFIFDPETLRFTYVNMGAMRQLGYTREELLAMTPLDLNPGLDEAAFRKLIAPLLRGERSVLTFESIGRRKDGGTLPVEINLQYIAPDGERPRFIALVRDITERKKLEGQLLRAQRLESIGTLAGGIAHDLNNALAPIMMGVEMLKVEYPAGAQMLDTIQTCAKRAADMVRQLLTFAKGAEGERVSLHADRLVRELEKLMNGSFPKNLQLVVKCDPKLPLVRGDATQLHQVLLNLCVNARDAMPHGGTLTLEAERREVDAAYASTMPDAKPGDYVALRVRDTGTGIPPEILDRIFDPFFTTKGPDKGTGLGLSIVLGIVKGHGGFLEVHSQPGKGSTFTVYLPVERAGSDTEQVTNAAVEFHGQGETILFVDDEAAVRETARAVLRRLNFKPLTATDGADGVIQAAQHRTEIRAIIVDLHMPHMDGLAFVRAVRRMMPDIPVVVASGRMDDAVAEKFKTLGVTRRLDKPFTEAQLAETLKNLLAAT